MSKITKNEINKMRDTINKASSNNPLKSSFKLALDSFEKFVKDNKLINSQKESKRR